MRTAWPAMVSTVLGLVLLAAPSVLGYAESTAGATHQILGATVTSLAFIACSEITRGVRWANMVPAAWLLVAPLVVGYDFVPQVVSLVAGAGILALTPLGRPDPARFGGGWRTVTHAEDPPPP